MLLKLVSVLTLCTLAVAGHYTKDDYIIGGEDVTVAGKWPWQGSLRLWGAHRCGVSLISDTWAVTAAHCIKGQAASDLTALFGSNYRREEDGGTVYNVKNYIYHENYGQGDGNYPNDIAVLTFTEPVTGEHIDIVPLAAKGSDHSGNPDCWITGWGQTSGSSAILPEILQEAHITVYTNDNCFWSAEELNDGHVCVGDLENGRVSCNGDSGGPLVCKVDGRYELVGATSWGIANCWSVLPGVYSRVAYFKDWITEKTGVQ